MRQKDVGYQNLPVLWCREWIETAQRSSSNVLGVYLPVLWCREWIETPQDATATSKMTASPCTLVQGVD